MPKVCPFLLVDADYSEPAAPHEFNCLEDKCAWWVGVGDGALCAVALLASMTHDTLVGVFPSTTPRER